MTGFVLFKEDKTCPQKRTKHVRFLGQKRRLNCPLLFILGYSNISLEVISVAQKQVAKAWFSETVTDSKGNKHKAVTVIRDIADCDFQKVFASELLQQIITSENDDFPVKNLRKVLFIITTILSMANRENKIVATQNEFAEALGMTARSVRRYLNSFKKLDLIQNVGPGRWILNNDIFSQVPAGERKELVIQYRSVKAKKEADKNQRTLFEDEVEQELQAVNA